MKKQVFRFVVACIAIFSVLPVSAQKIRALASLTLPSAAQDVKLMQLGNGDSVYTYFQGDTLCWYRDDVLYYYHKKEAKVTRKGLHVDFDAAFSIYGGSWGVSSSISSSNPETDYKADLRINYTAGANVALLYQTSDVFRGGIGTGIRIQQLEYTVNGAGSHSKSYGIPLYVRGGICESFSENLAGYMEADAGILIGTNNLRTTFLFDFQLGIYYGNAKIGLGFMPTSPNPEPFFPETKVNGRFAMDVVLALGFNI